MTTRKLIEKNVTYLNQRGIRCAIDRMSTGYRLVNETGSRDISPRLKASVFLTFLQGMITTLDEQERNRP